MNILFLTIFDSLDAKVWSGTLFHIHHKLKEKHHVETIGAGILMQLELFAKDNFIESFISHISNYVYTLISNILKLVVSLFLYSKQIFFKSFYTIFKYFC